MTACKEETKVTLADVDCLIGKVLVNDDYYGTLVQTWVDVGALNQALESLEGIMADECIDCDPHDDIVCAFDTTDPDQACRAILRAYELLDGIEDPWLWTEHEHDLGTAIEALREQVADVDWDRIG